MLLFAIVEAFAEEGGSGFTLAEIWDHSGFLARAVIITLLGMMLGSMVISIERLLAFNTARNQSRALAQAVVPHLESGDLRAALELAGSEEFKSAYLGKLLSAGLRELDLRMDAHGIHNAKRAVDQAVGLEIARLKRGMPILATTGSTAPFVGLFGTTFGVINAFQGMATAGSGLASISAGISEALITTGVGIGVAVLGVWFFNYFNNRVEKVVEELASSEADFMGWADKQIQKQMDAKAAK